MDYIVVYEYNQNAGGNAGVCFTRKFKSKAEFQQTVPDPNAKIIIEAATEKSASFLNALTPEICRITAAIEASSNTDGTIDIYILDRNLNLAADQIRYDRHFSLINDLDRFANFEFEKCIACLEPTEKNFVLNRALDLSESSNGRVDIDIIIKTFIKQTIRDILTNRMLISF